MTPFQYQFPHFLSLPKLLEELSVFGFTARTHQFENQNEYLEIGKFEKTEDEKYFHSAIEIESGTLLMIQGNFLFTWEKFKEGLEIRQYQLDHHPIKESLQTEFISIPAIEPGQHHHPTKLSYDYFVTFARKDNLERKEDFHEQYIILILHKDQLYLIPFTAFNETGGDPMYEWPALAALDIANGKLHGLGMRMGSFTIDLHL